MKRQKEKVKKKVKALLSKKVEPNKMPEMYMMKLQWHSRWRMPADYQKVVPRKKGEL